MFTCYLIQTGGPVTRPEPRCFASSVYLNTLFLPAKIGKEEIIVLNESRKGK
jgi:hypothetical protein